MTEPNQIRYEASDIDPGLTGDLALLVMETQKGRVTVHMRRTVFLHLFDRMKVVLAESAPPAQPQ